jgi:tRNA pseudouridine38-40 synthase
MRIALGLEYDGRHFQGWQFLGEKQRTVQAVLQAALSRVADCPVKVYCAGRTDSGVHATGQVAHFDTDVVRSDRAWLLGTNTYLPPDVAVTWVRNVPDIFHARFKATGRVYRYLICNRMAPPASLAGKLTWDYRPLDVKRMQAAADLLIGEHDFSAFRAQACQAKTAVRTLRRLTVWRDGDLVGCELEANAFLYHMVRNIVGVLTAIGAGAAEPGWAGQLLADRDRSKGGVTAAPDGLYLVEVHYPTEFDLPRTRNAALLP